MSLSKVVGTPCGNKTSLLARFNKKKHRNIVLHTEETKEFYEHTQTDIPPRASV